jgi:hypothetical protein
MQLEHGVAQHFRGAMFTHQTCLIVCHCGQKLSVSNHEDNFLIAGWGDFGGHREAAEAAACVHASSIC